MYSCYDILRYLMVRCYCCHCRWHFIYDVVNRPPTPTIQGFRPVRLCFPTETGGPQKNPPHWRSDPETTKRSCLMFDHTNSTSMRLLVSPRFYHHLWCKVQQNPMCHGTSWGEGRWKDTWHEPGSRYCATSHRRDHWNLGCRLWHRKMTWLESWTHHSGHFGYLKWRDCTIFCARFLGLFSAYICSAQNPTGRQGTEITVGPTREGGGLLLAIAIPGPKDPIPEGKNWRSLDHGFHGHFHWLEGNIWTTSLLPSDFIFFWEGNAH